MVPYCKELIDTAILKNEHLTEIKSYYGKIHDRVKPILEKEKDFVAIDYLSEQIDIKF